MLIRSLYLFVVIFSLTACQIISPLIIDYNGVRRDVAQYINSSWKFSLSDRQVLVHYAREQQKVLRFSQLTTTQQIEFAQQNAIERYCAEQKVSKRKLNLIDQQIFAYPAQQAQLLHLQQLQNTHAINHPTCL